jgi:hypothetical protein
MDVEDPGAYDKLYSESTDKPAFSNGSEWEIWEYNNCMKCVHEPRCALIDLILIGRTPPQLKETSLHDYTCSEYKVPS